MRHSLVQKIVKAYEKHDEATGVNRQLSLRLGDPDGPAQEVRQAEDPSTEA